MNQKQRANALLQKYYSEYRTKLFAYCLSRLDGARETADDCVQEAFIVFYNRLLSGEEFENPRAFLYRTADNFVKREKQKAATEMRREIPLESARDIAVNDEDFTARLDAIDYEMFAETLIALLSDEEKIIYDLRYTQKISVEEIANTLGISRPAASMRLMRLRNKIKEMVYSANIDMKGG